LKRFLSDDIAMELPRAVLTRANHSPGRQEKRTR